MSRPECACGCGSTVARPEHRFIHGHNGRLQSRPECSVVTCHERVHAHGMCGRHRMRIAKHGELYPVTPTINAELWFWAHVALPTEPDGCWLWTGNLKPNGYGEAASVRLSPTRTTLAHRWAFEQRRGAIPDGAHLDHLCRNIRCVNPEHLDPVTPAENTRRGLHGELRTHCKQNHELTPENTYVKKADGSRRCRKCAADAVREKRAAVRSEMGLAGRDGAAA